MRGIAALLGILTIGVLHLWACAEVSPSSPQSELGRVVAERYASGTLIVWGTGAGCIEQPAMSLRFIEHGKGTYSAPSQSCPAPDGGVATLCDFGLEAKLGATPGTGTLKIQKVADTIWGDFEGELNLTFPTADGEKLYAFSFVAPVCGVE